MKLKIIIILAFILAIIIFFTYRWRNQKEEFIVNHLDHYLIYKDGTTLDLKIYKNGLKAWQLLKLLNDETIKSVDGRILREIPKGTHFTVLPMDPSIGYFGRIKLI